MSDSPNSLKSVVTTALVLAWKNRKTLATLVDFFFDAIWVEDVKDIPDDIKRAGAYQKVRGRVAMMGLVFPEHLMDIAFSLAYSKVERIPGRDTRRRRLGARRR